MKISNSEAKVGGELRDELAIYVCTTIKHVGRWFHLRINEVLVTFAY